MDIEYFFEFHNQTLETLLTTTVKYPQILLSYLESYGKGDMFYGQKYFPRWEAHLL